MPETSDSFFRECFSLLSYGKAAYPWQVALFVQFVSANWPHSLALPTGAGKTSILKIWLLALAWTLKNGQPAAIPRRLIWVVNRRVVVDQTTEEAREVANWLNQNPTSELTNLLQAASFTKKQPLAISTLRGQKADNGEWSRDPLVPAIVVGTVDMIGSRLLFRGYRDGRYNRSKNAGLMGVDSLIVNDESHLTPAFAQLLKTIENLEPAGTIGRPFRTLLVSATVRDSGSNAFQHDIRIDLEQSPHFRRIYEAEKRLYLRSAPSASKAVEEIARIAREHSSPRTILFIEQPEQAAKIAAKLAADFGDENVALLTGTMRGLERDQDQRGGTAFARFTQSSIPGGNSFLVCTSAGEVGVNMTCETMASALVESDRLFQRLGRLNRFGGSPGKAFVVAVESNSGKTADDAEQRRGRTLEYLKTLPVLDEGGFDVSCRTLAARQPPEDSRSVKPAIARFEERLVDLWSQTTPPSGCMRGTAGAFYMPLVDPWLHGKQENNYPETSVAWRAEVSLLANPNVDDTDRSNALARYPVLPHEMLKEPTRRLKEKLEKIDAPSTAALLQDADGDFEVLMIKEFLSRNDEELRDALLLLPPGFGRLSKGMLQDDGGHAANDVADDVPDDLLPRRRFELLPSEPGSWRRRRLATSEGFEELTDWRFGLDDPKPLRIEIPGETSETDTRWLVLDAPRRPGEKQSELLLETHLRSVSTAAQQLATLALGHSDAVYFDAGRLHDVGKSYPLWQKAMGGNPEKCLAKSNRAVTPRLLNGFRHELKSYLTAPADGDDLLLHLIASHHGWARPYWEAKACPPEDLSDPGSQKKLAEVPRRFARLQKRWGPWGLAYLEALLKSADVLGDETSDNV